jgi:micrococcal nuclease
VKIMIETVLATLILTATATPTDARYTCDFVKVLDGDTVKVVCPEFPLPFQHLSVRVIGIDTPESREPPAKCVKEVKLGLIAKEWAKAVFKGETKVTFTWAGEDDKYGGRVLGNVILPNGRDWAEEAIRLGHARPYGLDGSLTKSDWCN